MSEIAFDVEYLNYRRRLAGLSRAAVARRTGLSWRKVSKACAGERLTVETIVRICEAIGVDASLVVVTSDQLAGRMDKRKQLEDLSVDARSIDFSDDPMYRSVDFSPWVGLAPGKHAKEPVSVP